MPRRVQDIIPNNRRSIKDVETKRHHETHAKTINTEVLEPKPQERKTDENFHKNIKRQRNGLRWLLITIGIIVVIAGIGYVASVYFSRATFTLIPKTVSGDIDSLYVAQENSATSSVISYEAKTIKSIASTTIPATAGAPVSTKAQGNINIYNSFSGQAQRLVAGTRIATSDGRIYRLTSSVVIPGYSYSSDKISKIPGFTQVNIIADQAGDTYNITGQDSISDFKIPAYIGTPKYETVYGRLTSEITGGFIGSKKNIDPRILASSTTQLEASLTSSLLAQARSTISSNQIMYDTGYTITFSTSTDMSSGLLSNKSLSSSTVNLIISATIKIFVFQRKDLASHLLGATTTASFGIYGYNISGLDELDMKFIPTKSMQTSVHAKGPVKLVGIIPVTDIQKKLAGRSLGDLPSIMKPYSQVVESATGELMPPWANIPIDIGRISIVIKAK